MAIAPAKRTHANPVHGGYFADPFVWKHDDVYYAIGTGAPEASGQILGNVFPVLKSEDFYEWRFAGNALLPPDPRLGTHFWAPEVAWSEGTFYLFYSVGFGDQHHQLRVATSEFPMGPYRDSGRALLDCGQCPFAIDAHPFRDDDGHWYLFYARDFLDATPAARAGTAVVVSPLRTMLELEDEWRTVVRARSDWQRFEANRSMHGRVWDWHTIEGPFVRKHEGRYYCFYSAGRWENETYGVDYGVADHVLGPYSDKGNENGPRVLKTVPNEVLGPGHNSVVAGPDGSDYIVYHAWDRQMKSRRMFVNRLLWTPAGPRCDGPSRESAGF